MSKKNIKAYSIKSETLCKKCKHEACIGLICLNCPMYVDESHLVTKFNCYCLTIHSGDRCERFERKENANELS